MGAQPTRLKTHAETQLAAQFSDLGEVSPDRRAAFAAFEAAGLPHKRVEAYHFTDVRAALREAMPLAQLAEHAPPRRRAEDGASVIVVRDGRYDAALSDALPPGVTLEVRAPSGPPPSDPVIALNRAFCAEELVLRVAAGVAVEAPVRIEAISSGQQAHAVFRRTRVELGAGASLTLAESAHGSAAPSQANVLLSLDLADGATLAHVTVIHGGRGIVLASLEARVGANCQLSSFAMLSGGALIRRQLFVAMAGAHSQLSLDGVGLLRGSEHIDTTLTVTHEAPHCTSRETFRHIVDGEATGVFQGKIVVAPGAQKTDGKMMSKSIVLADGAVMNNKPELEIFADDVVCGHGATVGGLDEAQVFYARSRGIPKAEAEALLLEAFAGEVVDVIAHEATRERMRTHLARWLADRKA